jgi:hypothetical protein
VFEKLTDGKPIKELIEQDDVKSTGSPISVNID